MTTHHTAPSAPVQPAVAPSTPSFRSLELAEPIQKALEKAGFTTPTPIQNGAIPVVLTGQDLIGIAQTGTGKTLAFGLPMLDRFLTVKNRGRGLILLPTRELALQVDEALTQIGREFGLKTCVLIGGAPIRPQQQQLRRDPDIIIATPGRLIDHLQNNAVDLRAIDTLVLDEADRMLDMGFAPQIRRIVSATPDERQTLLFSATMPDEIVKLSEEFLYQPARVEIEKPGTSAQGITQELFIVPQEKKTDLLAKVLYEYTGSVLVFARTRSRARRVAREVNRMDIRAAEIHADRTLSQRRAALDGFKNGTFRVLVATDIAARGIDVTGIELVVNYDLPDTPEDFVHRIGRTGRAGLTGHAIAFAAPDQASDVRAIEKTMRLPIPLSEFNEGEFDASAVAKRPGRRAQTRRASSGGSRSHSPGANSGSPRGGRRPARAGR